MLFGRILSTVLLTVFVMTVKTASAQEPIFSFSPSSYADIVSQGGKAVGELSVQTTPFPCIDFRSGGHFIVPDFSFPQEAFSIESHFLISKYAASDPYISSIASAWNPDHRNAYVTEGIDFRIGGGYNYPLLPTDAYDGVDDYVRAGVDRSTRAKLSECIGEFVLGTNQSPWKEVFTDRCVPLNEWVHMVATWDGKEMRLFMNGRDATDGWRTSGVDIPAFYKEVHDLVIGTDNWSTLRNVHGLLTVLNVYDTALSLSEVRKKYHATLPSGTCQVIVEIITPLPGEVIDPSTKLKFSIAIEGDCGMTTLNAKSFTVELSTESDFSNIVYSTMVAFREVTLLELLSDATQLLETAMFIRIKPQRTLAKSIVDDTFGVTSSVVPIMFNKTTSIVGKIRDTYSPVPQLHYKNILQNKEGNIFDLYGRNVSSRFRENNLQSATGIYITRLNNSSRTIAVFNTK